MNALEELQTVNDEVRDNNARLSLPDVLIGGKEEGMEFETTEQEHIEPQLSCLESQSSKHSEKVECDSNVGASTNVNALLLCDRSVVASGNFSPVKSCNSYDLTADCEPSQVPLQDAPISNAEEPCKDQSGMVGAFLYEGPASPAYDFENPFMAQLITGAFEEFKGSCEEPFTKGCKWSPDGTCILTNSEDKVLRIFDLPAALHCQEAWATGRTLPELRPTLRIKEGGRVYDYCWFPFMSSLDPLSCCLVACSQFAPVHLWDAYSGQLRATYRAYNSMDEIEHAFSVTFDLTGQKLYCGFKKRLCVFDTARPGSTCETRILKDLGSPVGIVSCICVNPADERMYAFSSYSRTIGLCSEPGGDVMCLLCNEGGGLTHIAFSPDGRCLYAGSRNDCLLFCWDTRMLGKVLFTTQRPGSTNQRIYFDQTPDGRHLLSGSTDGRVLIWDTQQAPEYSPCGEVPVLPVLTSFPAHGDCVNGLSLHKQYPVLATASGQRHPYCPDCDSDGEGPPGRKKRHTQREDTLKLWWMGRSAFSSL